MNPVNNTILAEKYRPSTISDCILPKAIESMFQGMVFDKIIPHILMYGIHGTGKTTTARALVHDLNADSIFINCSEHGGIDTLRTMIRGFATTRSLEGRQKIVVLDEFDYSNAQSIQPALRGAMEEFSKNCRFIITCNHKERIIPEIHSRCAVVDFTTPSAEKAALAQKIMERLEWILVQEKVECDKQVLATLIKKHFPDMRRMLNEIQKHSSNGKIEIGVLSQGSSDCYTQLLGFMKAKDFVACRKWVVQNIDHNTVDFYRSLYTAMYTALKQNSIPQAILILAEYQYKAAFAADQEINTMALIVQLMLECEFI